MQTCPVCTQPGFTLWRKSNASSTLPASCVACGAMAHVDDRIQVAGALLGEIFPWTSIALAIYLQAWQPLLIFPLGAVTWVVGIGRAARLIPIDAPKVSAQRKSAIGRLLVWAMLVYAAYLAFGRA